MLSVKTAFNGFAFGQQGEKKKQTNKTPDPAYVFSKSHLYAAVVVLHWPIERTFFYKSNLYKRQNSSIQIYHQEKIV